MQFIDTMYRFFLRTFTVLFYWLLKLCALIIPKPRPIEGPLDLLITGTFYSDQWLITHLTPLALSKRVGNVTMVASRPVPSIKGVSGVHPPQVIHNLLGEVMARNLYFFWLGLTGKYQLYGGFHLLLNGMFAALLAKARRGHSIYICGGGPREVAGGGFETENRLYGRLRSPDLFLESLLLKFVNEIDHTICMGSSAATYFRDRASKTKISIIPGGFSPDEFYPTDDKAEFDLILVGRLSEVKQVDVFLEAIAKTRETIPDVTAVIVGDGPDRAELEAQSDDLELSNHVTFAGWQNNVADWFRRSRVFVLTSSSEGLSQALLQGMLSGLPAVVSDVGDLSDCVADNENGYLVTELTATSFSEKFLKLLSDPARYDQMRSNAIQSSAKYHFPRVAELWDQVL